MIHLMKAAAMIYPMHRNPVLICSIALIACIVLSGCIANQQKDQKTDGNRFTPAMVVSAPATARPESPVTSPAIRQTPECIPDWACSNWSVCNSSKTQVRVCLDRKKCGILQDKPAEGQGCTYTAPLRQTGPYTIRVDGDPVCRMTVNAALDQLKYRASTDYEFVRKYVGEINCSARDTCYMTGFNPGEQPFYTVCIAPREEPPTIFVDQPFWNADPLWLAGVLVHEACHSEGYREYIQNTEIKYDLTEFSGWKFERRCCDRMRTTWNQLGAPALNNDLYRYCDL
jgi:hypothetical protein